jgi:hypothetical protein
MIDSRVLVDLLPFRSSGLSSSVKRSILFHYHSLITLGPGREWIFILEHGASLPRALTGIPGVSFLRVKKWPGSIGWSLWYAYRLPALLRKYRAGWFFGLGSVALTNNVRIRQIIWFPGKSGLPAEDDLHGKYCYKKLKASMKAANFGLVFFQNTREILRKEWPEAGVGLQLVRDYKRPMLALDPEEKNDAKTKFAGGRDYFLCFPEGSESNTLNLLKAYSIFKKRQQTNMRLVLTSGEWIKEKLSFYAYREELSLTGDLKQQEFRLLLSGAYALIDLGSEFLIDLYHAFAAGVPVLAAGKELTKEPFFPALFNAGWLDPQSMAREFMTVYTNEKLRFSKIESGNRYWTDHKKDSEEGGAFGLL